MTTLKVQQQSLGYGSIKPVVVNETSCLVNQNDPVRATTGTMMKRNAVSEQVALIGFGVSLLLISFVVAVVFYPSTSSSSFPSSLSSSISMVALDSSSSTESVDSNQNLLIEKLQSTSTTIHPQSEYKDKVNEFPSMSIDVEHERQVYNDNVTKDQTTITISWTDGEFRDSKDTILSNDTDDQNIIALQCGKTESKLHIVDAKSLSDATSSSSTSSSTYSSTSSSDIMITENNIRYRRNLRASNNRQLTEWKWFHWDKDHWDKKDHHHDDHDNESKWHTITEHNYEHTNAFGTNVWYIPSLPDSVLYDQHQQQCQAVIYYYINDNEYVTISKSRFVYL